MINRRLLGLILGVNQTLSWGTTFFLPAIVAGPAGRTFGVRPVAILGAFSWALLVAGFCAPRVGRWIDRHGGRGALLVSIVAMVSGQVILAAAPTLAFWYWGWTVIGVGMAMGLYDAAFATVSSLLGREAGSTISGITVVAGFASSVFWSLGSALIGPFGWRGLLLFYAGLMIAVNLPMVWLLVPPTQPYARETTLATARGRGTVNRFSIFCLAGFFTVRWFITSTIAVNVLKLLQGTGLSVAEAVAVAALIGPGQVLGRMMEWIVGSRFGLLMRARLGAILLPIGAALLPIGGPIAASAFALLYGMSNGVLTINRGTLPLALFGPNGYATLLGWLAVPVLLAQATAPTLMAPLIDLLPARDMLLVAGGVAAGAVLLLLPLRVPAGAVP